MDKNEKAGSLDALMEAAFANRDLLEEFYARLASSDLYILTPDKDTAEGVRRLEAGSKVNLATFPMQDGSAFIPAFTSMAELRNAVQDDYGVMAMPTADLFRLVNGTIVVINPSRPHALVLSGESQQLLMQRMSVHKMEVQENTSVMLAQPAEDPTALKVILADIFKKDGSVQAAYLSLMMNPQAGEQSLLIGVVFKPGQVNEKIFETCGIGAKGHIPQGLGLDFLIIDQNDADGISGALMRSGSLFFGCT